MAITLVPPQVDRPFRSHNEVPMVISAEEYPREYQVNNLSSQADFGRRKLETAKVGIPGLIAFQYLYGLPKPLNNAKITCSLDITPQTGVLVEALIASGANVRLCSSSISSTDDHVAAAIARDSASVFAWKGQTVEQNLSCMARAVDWGPSGGPDLILDDGGVLTRLIHEGVLAEKEFARTGAFPDVKSTGGSVHKSMLTVISESLKSDPMKHHKIMDRLVGFTINNSRAATMLLQLQMQQTLLFPVLNVTESVSKSKFANYWTGGFQSLPDDLMDATDIKIAGKVALVAGYGQIGRCCAAALQQAKARVIVTEMDPDCALQATEDGIQVRRLKDAFFGADILVITSGDKDKITVEDMRKMKNNAILCKIGSSDTQLDMLGLETFPGVERINISPLTDRWVFSDTGRAIIVVAEGGPMNLSCNTGPPSFAKSFSLTTQVIAQLELWKERSSGKYEKKVYEFPKHLTDLVTALHHENLREDQADHISLEVEGDHQPANNVQVEGDNNDRDRAGQCMKVFALVVSVFGLVASCVDVIVGVTQLALVYGGSN